MNKGIIIYKTWYGSTREYAEWIGEETGFKVVDVKSKPEISQYQTVIIGCPIRKSKLSLSEWIKKTWIILSDKQVILFSTSMADPDAKIVKLFYFNSLPREIRKRVKWFPLPGRMLFNNLSLIDKLIMNIATFLVKNKEQKKAMKANMDGVDRSTIDEIVKLV